jgi:hypothetical protein
MRQRHLLLLQLNKTGRVESLRSPHEPVCSAGNPMRLIGGAGSSREVRLPPGYSLDRSDPDVLILRCPHGALVARFSAQGATAEAIEQEARTHYKERNRTA